MFEQKRVLVVEDDAEIREVIKSFLHEIGIERVEQASNGYEAIKYIDLSDDVMDLVICDWNMPGMSGYSVMRQLKTTHPKMPLMMLTSRNDTESVLMAKDLGLQAYLVKPLTIEQLESKLQKVLKH